MARRNDLGVRVIFRCPGCGDQHEETVPAGLGHYPGQVIDEPHLPGMCSFDIAPPNGPGTVTVTFTDVPQGIIDHLIGEDDQ